MLKKIALFILFLVFLVATQYVPTIYPDEPLLLKTIETLAILSFALLLDSLVGGIVARIQLYKLRYFLAKTSSYLIYAIALIIALGIWIEQTQSLVVAMGFIGAGIAIALQRPLMNLVGFLALITVRPYEVGDRIEVEGVGGDVIDIELMYTKLMEIGGNENYDQFTGKIKEIPNSFIMEKVVTNYSKDFGFIWEEMMLPITYSSNLKKATGIMENAASTITKQFVEKSEKQLKSMTYKYLLEPRDVKPSVYIVPTDNWVELRLRFIVDAKHRRRHVDPIFREILKKFQNAKDITISSKTSARIWDATRKKRDY
ncbi:mechanosensitive ion channel [Candidatus Micrarchaeota archaeon]|nr:mechanosensitive ion channel [Candidatus Micrarchaeota archaeon]MBD3417759.1 mechanosensitive ion channel [Candidatus Micrarchaeota archaeon]